MKPKSQTILDYWQVTAEELTDVINSNPSLRGMILGYLAEVKLRNMWFSKPKVDDAMKYDDHDRKRKGDLVITYKGKQFIVEAKSLQTNTIRREGQYWVGKAQCDASDRRTIKFPDGSKLETTCLLVGEFDLLAVNLFAFENKWQFVFAKNKDLPRSTFKKYTKEQRDKLLASLVGVTYPPKPPFRDEPFSLLDEIAQERIR